MNNLKQKTDEELMVMYAQEAQVEAFDELYSRHSGRVYGFLRSKIFDQSQVDDVFQSVFLKLHNARHQYDPQFAFTPWLFTICHSILVDYLRKTQRRSREQSNEDLVDRAMAPQSEMERAIPSEFAGYGTLSAAQKEALNLRYNLNMDFSEIAKRLQTSPTNVRQLVSRAIRKIKGGNNEKI